MVTHLLQAKSNTYADKVVLVGDPKRAQYISDKFLSETKLITQNRGLLGFTGTYKNKKISIQTTGMGGPSAAIVVEELNQLGVSTFVRLGSCGAFNNSSLGKLILVEETLRTDGTTYKYSLNDKGFIASCFVKKLYPDGELLLNIKNKSKILKTRILNKNIVTTDLFYNYKIIKDVTNWQKMNYFAVEMETSVVFYLAKKFKKRAACLLVVSDFIDVRQQKFTNVYSDKQKKRLFDLSLNKAITLILESLID